MNNENDIIKFFGLSHQKVYMQEQCPSLAEYTRYWLRRIITEEAEVELNKLNRPLSRSLEILHSTVDDIDVIYDKDGNSYNFYLKNKCILKIPIPQDSTHETYHTMAFKIWDVLTDVPTDALGLVDIAEKRKKRRGILPAFTRLSGRVSTNVLNAKMQNGHVIRQIYPIDHKAYLSERIKQASSILETVKGVAQHELVENSFIRTSPQNPWALECVFKMRKPFIDLRLALGDRVNQDTILTLIPEECEQKTEYSGESATVRYDRDTGIFNHEEMEELERVIDSVAYGLHNGRLIMLDVDVTNGNIDPMTGQFESEIELTVSVYFACETT